MKLCTSMLASESNEDINIGVSGGIREGKGNCYIEEKAKEIEEEIQ